MEYNPYTALANAIIEKAVEDYRNPKHYQERTVIKKFFLSKWFSVLTEIDGKTLLKSEDDKDKDEASEDKAYQQFMKDSDCSVHNVGFGDTLDDGASVDSYTAAVDDEDNIYIFYASSPNDPADTDTTPCREVYATAMVKDDAGNANWSAPNKLTNSGMVNDGIAVAINEDGQLMTVNRRYNYDLESTPIGLCDVQLVSTSFKPSGSVEVTDITLSDTTPKAGDKITVRANIKNTGLTTAAGYTVNFFEAKNGSLVSDEPIYTAQSDEKLIANHSQTADFDWIPSDVNGTYIIAVAYEKGYESEEDMKSFESEELQSTAAYSVNMKSIYQKDGKFYADYTVTNTGNVTSGEDDIFEISFKEEYADAEKYGIEDEIFASTSLAGIEPGTTKAFTTKLNIPECAFKLCRVDCLRLFCAN